MAKVPDVHVVVEPSTQFAEWMSEINKKLDYIIDHLPKERVLEIGGDKYIMTADDWMSQKQKYQRTQEGFFVQARLINEED